MLGVDEFALRKGHRYGTLLVDVETRRPVDILDGAVIGVVRGMARRPPGRGADLPGPGGVLLRRRRPGRAGARCRSPTGGICGTTSARPSSGRSPGTASTCRQRSPQAAAPAATTAPEPAAAPAIPRTGRIADRTRDRHADVHRMLAGGRSIGEIAAELGLSRNTVRRFARAASPDELLVSDGTGRRASILDEHAPYLRERWNSGCTNAALLWQEIRARGYQGGCRQVRGYLARFRGNAAVPAPAPVPPKVRAVTAWIMTRPDRLADADKASLDAILAASPELAAVTASVRDFAVIMNERRGRKLLEPWMTAALATGEPALRSFVTGLRADQDAVTNGLSLPWSSGAVEGHVNRIKMLKRQMYGRASPDLLRRRVLLAD